jgi:hypothetical protein
MKVAIFVLIFKENTAGVQLHAKLQNQNKQAVSTLLNYYGFFLTFNNITAMFVLAI